MAHGGDEQQGWERPHGHASSRVAGEKKMTPRRDVARGDGLAPEQSADAVRELDGVTLEGPEGQGKCPRPLQQSPGQHTGFNAYALRTFATYIV